MEEKEECKDIGHDIHQPEAEGAGRGTLSRTTEMTVAEQQPSLLLAVSQTPHIKAGVPRVAGKSYHHSPLCPLFSFWQLSGRKEK